MPDDPDPVVPRMQCPIDLTGALSLYSHAAVNAAYEAGLFGGVKDGLSLPSGKGYHFTYYIENIQQYVGHGSSL